MKNVKNNNDMSKTYHFREKCNHLRHTLKKYITLVLEEDNKQNKKFGPHFIPYVPLPT